MSIKPHPFFQRDGADLYCRVPISMVQAALGGEFTVRTLDGGDAKVRIPEGAQSGHQLRLRGKGMPVLRSRDFGDLYIQANVETPQNLTRRQRELLAEFEAESSHKTQPESAGFFAKMKEFFEGLSGQSPVLRRAPSLTATQSRRAGSALRPRERRRRNGVSQSERATKRHPPHARMARVPSRACCATKALSSRPCSKARG